MRYDPSDTVSSKGQVTVPKGIRDYPGPKAGSTVTVERRPGREIVLRPSEGPTRQPASLFARLRGRTTVRMSTDKIMALTRGF